MNIQFDYSPYWTDFHRELSSRLWLPTETVLQDLDSKSSRLLARSWFSTETKFNNFDLISSPESIRPGTLHKSKKIRIYPTKGQVKLFRKWFGINRKAYNDTIEHLREPGTIANWKSIKTDIIKALPWWAEDTPYHIRSIAIRDACQAVLAAKKKFLAGDGFQDVKFRSKKNHKQSCYIPHSAINTGGIFLTLSGKVLFSERLPKNYGDSRLVCENDRWFLVVSYEVETKPTENQGRIVALDPGVRTFQTWYSETGCGKSGTGDFQRITRLCLGLDILISKKAKTKLRFKRRNLQKAILRQRWKIQDLVNELHHKTALFLVTNFDIILLPSFGVSQMVLSGKRKIRTCTVRSMLSFAHYRFSQFLKHKAREYGKLVIEVNEAYTSKTVSWTGEIVQIGSRKTIRDSEGVCMDRDYNGARGIFLRALGDHPELMGNLQFASAPDIAKDATGSEN